MKEVPLEDLRVEEEERRERLISRHCRRKERVEMQSHRGHERVSMKPLIKRSE